MAVPTGILMAKHDTNPTILKVYRYRVGTPNPDVAVKVKVTKAFKDAFSQWVSDNADQFPSTTLGFTYSESLHGVYALYGKKNITGGSEAYIKNDLVFGCKMVQEPNSKPGHDYGSTQVPAPGPQLSGAMRQAALSGLVDSLYNPSSSVLLGIHAGLNDITDRTVDAMGGAVRSLIGSTGEMISGLLGLDAPLTAAPIPPPPPLPNRWVIALNNETVGDIGDDFPTNEVFGEDDGGAAEDGGASVINYDDFLKLLNAVLKNLQDTMGDIGTENAPKPTFFGNFSDLLDEIGKGFNIVGLGATAIKDVLDAATTASELYDALSQIRSKAVPLLAGLINGLLNNMPDGLIPKPPSGGSDSDSDSGSDSDSDSGSSMSKDDWAEVFDAYFINDQDENIATGLSSITAAADIGSFEVIY